MTADNQAQEFQPFSIGHYKIIKIIGSGGMGQVFLAYDTTCGRKIALKKIRTDLIQHQQLHNRFLHEARITSQLTHPAIIPIYAIHSENKVVYYTMPYVEGKTLKQLFATAHQYEKKGEKLDQIGASIPALIATFLSVCQAVAYAHSKGVLHRDLKPENIIVGPYGEVLILDWGLAKMISDSHLPTDSLEELPEFDNAHTNNLTNIGKVVGTVAYMAPERAMGNPATLQTDVYALGVILYQILTLRHPFQRGSLKKFRENIHNESLYDPCELAPYRDVPRILSRITLKCLSKSLEERYKTVDDLITDLKIYLEGRSDWFQITELNINKKDDWEFQENVFLAEHVAITRGTEMSDWVSLMISNASFQENTKIEVQVRIGEHGHGIGFLLSIPEISERVHLNDGYCLWLSSDLHQSTKLLRSTLEVVHAPDIYLNRQEWYQVRIEKIDHNIFFYLNDVLQFSYISYLPLIGTHMGILSRDADFSLKNFFVSVGSQSLKVNCLAVPDAFLAHKDYNAALSEYRRIGYTFSGTAESREAMFRAGITQLERARSSALENGQEAYELALEEFELLRNTPGAPFEYLGKALVYQSLKENEEEIKCFEIAYRRYPKHPLLPVLQEQIVYRMHESSHSDRKATYNFIFFTLRHLPEVCASNHAQKLFSSLKSHWEPLFFIEETNSENLSKQLLDLSFALRIAFWLAKPFFLVEIIDELSTLPSVPCEAICNGLFCLIELGAWEIAEEKLGEVSLRENDSDSIKYAFDLIRVAILAHKESLKRAQEVFLKLKTEFTKASIRIGLHLMELGIKAHQYAHVHEIAEALLASKTLSDDERLHINTVRVWTFLEEGNWSAAGEILQGYPLEDLTRETTLLHFLYGCWLYVIEGKEIAQIHFYSILEVSFPRSWTLFSHFIHAKREKKQAWLQNAFLWEKRQLYKQFALFHRCTGDFERSQHYQELEESEYTRPYS